MIKQLLNSAFAKYRDLFVSRRKIIGLSLRLRQIIDLLATDKLRYFAQPRPIIVNDLQVLAAALLVFRNQWMALLCKATLLKTSLWQLMTYDLNVELYAARKVHVCLSTSARQQTTASVYAS